MATHRADVSVRFVDPLARPRVDAPGGDPRSPGSDPVEARPAERPRPASRPTGRASPGDTRYGGGIQSREARRQALRTAGMRRQDETRALTDDGPWTLEARSRIVDLEDELPPSSDRGGLRRILSALGFDQRVRGRHRRVPPGTGAGQR
jgi:hypothetical protein